ncbi:MAG: Ig-like domain-containing protein [Verrucomicrobia subdivision 3 bacterium]|nr:Ig-like domain-containing protein [Limisphaerales bacterium]
MRRHFLGILILTWTLWLRSSALAAPTIGSTVPANFASGVSPSAAVVFTFSEAMDPNPAVTFATFRDFSAPLTPLPISAAWNAANTILTCTPSPAFPASANIVWAVEGQNPGGDFLDGTTDGFFMTGTGTGGGTGSGTNALTTFSVGKVHYYAQTAAAAPMLDPTTPYFFSAGTTLSSNRTATNVVLTLPTAAVANLTKNPLHAEMYYLTGFETSLSNYDATYPAGNYSFLVRAVSSNQTVVVNLPTTNSLAQPNAPHLTNYPAAQAVDASQAFVLGWDAFAGGTASDYIAVDIAGGAGSVYGSTNVGSPGALTGTARTFTIPAGTLAPNSNYDTTISFFRFVGATNANYATLAYRATYTTFSLITTGGAVTGPLVLTNANWAPGAFSFDVLCTNGQTVTIEYTNVLSAGAWPKLLTTNSPGPRVHIVSPQAGSAPSLFYRARNGP